MTGSRTPGHRGADRPEGPRKGDRPKEEIDNLTERKGNLDPFDDINQRYKYEIFSYDDLHRLTVSARFWRGTMQQPTLVTYSYSPAGNLLSKSDYAEEYGYGSLVRSVDNAGPHAVAWVRKPGDIDPVMFGYDENGNLTRADGKSIEYDFLNKPVRIDNDTGEVTELFYGPNGERYKQVVTGSGPTRTTYYAGKLHERVIDSSGVRIDKDYVGDYLIIIDDSSDSAGRQLRYLHRDRLGSIELMTDQSGQLVGGESRSFDAFGKPRDGIWRETGGDSGALQQLTGRIALQGQTLTVRIDMIAGRLGNASAIINHVANTARSMGANVVRFEGTIANPRLMEVLSKRYNLVTQEATDFFEIMVK